MTISTRCTFQKYSLNIESLDCLLSSCLLVFLIHSSISFRISDFSIRMPVVYVISVFSTPYHMRHNI